MTTNRILRQFLSRLQHKIAGDFCQVLLRTFFAACFFPPSIQNDSFLFTSPLFTLSQSLSASCRFSTNKRSFAASQRLIFVWKFLLKSFFFSTPVKVFITVNSVQGKSCPIPWGSLILLSGQMKLFWELKSWAG